MKIGIDIQEVGPVKRFIGTNKMGRVFSVYELDYIKSKGNAERTVAGLYCAKEAFFKAVGCGIKISKLKEVEVKHDRNGAPFYNLSEDVKAEFSVAEKSVV